MGGKQNKEHCHLKRQRAVVLTCGVAIGGGREAWDKYSRLVFGIYDTILYKRMLGCSHESVLTKFSDIF